MDATKAHSALQRECGGTSMRSIKEIKSHPFLVFSSMQLLLICHVAIFFRFSPELLLDNAVFVLCDSLILSN